MAFQDEEFIKRLRETFNVEAEEHLQVISSMLLELEKSPPPERRAVVIETVYREVHTLKGAARAVDMPDVETICHALESIFSDWKSKRSSPVPEGFDVMHHALDAMRTHLSPATEKGADQHRQRNELIQRLHQLQSQRPTVVSEERADVQPPPAAPTPALAAAAAHAESEKAVIADTVRVSIAKLDARLLEAEDMLVIKAMSAQRALELRELTAQFDQWWKEWGKVSAEIRTLRQAIDRKHKTGDTSRPVAASSALVNFLDWNGDYFRSMESRLTVLAAQADQDRHGVNKRVDDLLADSKKLLMLPFATVAGSFPRLVRDLCRDQGKDAELVINGGDVEIDKPILEEIKDVLIHALRNCVDHGVEKPAERTRQKKPARATIIVSVSQVNGSKVEIAVSDDGAGIDVEQVKSSAIRHGVLSQAEAAKLTESEALELIFQSDVSTSPMVTSISGRGLGMTIVRSKTEKLGGKVTIESKRGVGTTLRMLLPLTIATFRGILVRSSGQIFVVPTVNVERVLRIAHKDIHSVENRETVSLQGRPVSLARLDTVLELPPTSVRQDDSSFVPIVVVQSVGQRIAFAVDEVLHEEEVLVKPLGKVLVKVRNLSGATVLGSGKAVPVLNVTDLIKSARRRGSSLARAEAADAPTGTLLKKVLVVEDSITSRMLLKGILESAGYQVKTAVDGMDAFTVLREGPFDLVVSDVEMPRMNGFDLTRSIRADKRLAEMPVVLVTAMEAREERERGIDAGANAYIIKSSFDQSNLLSVVAKLI